MFIKLYFDSISTNIGEYLQKLVDKLQNTIQSDLGKLVKLKFAHN